MLSDDEARDLLHRAADTIKVDPAEPLPTSPPRSRWPLLAAAAVALVLAVGLWLTQVGGSDSDGRPDPAPPATNGLTDGVPEGTVPSVFGHTRASATRLLEGVGVEVSVEERPDCAAPGRAIATLPGTGTPVAPGDTVTLQVAGSAADLDCALDPSEAWAFLDFANGHGPAPSFAAEVDVVVDDGRPGTLTNAEARDGAAWGNPSALGVLRQASSSVLRINDTYLTPTLGIREGTPPDELCGVRRPSSVGDREALILTVDIPVDGISHCPATVALYRTGGQIDAVVTWTEKPLGDSADPARQPVPDVVGESLEDARRTVTAAGYTARVEEIEACQPRPGVVEQAPTQQDAEDDRADDPGQFEVVTLVVEVPHTTRDCGGLAAAAEDFLRFARGGAPARWAPEVELYLGYAYQTSLTPAQADDPTSWSLCSGVPSDSCTVSAPVVSREGEVSTGAEVPAYECLSDLGGLPAGLSPEDWIVLHPTATASCGQEWVVQLWIDEGRRIRAVNLLVSER